jgi:FdhD protein
MKKTQSSGISVHDFIPGGMKLQESRCRPGRKAAHKACPSSSNLTSAFRRVTVEVEQVNGAQMRAPARSLELTQVKEWEDGRVRAVEDSLAAEEPLEIRIANIPLTVTMRTPGHDLELAAGFLLTEGIIESADQIVALRLAPAGNSTKSNLVEVELKDASFDTERMQRNFFAASSCGICGKASIEAIRLRGLKQLDRSFHINPELLCRLPEILRSEQAVFSRTGGLHAAALFDAEGHLMAVREDIGRHNAVDKIVGSALLEKHLPLSQNILLISGRGGFEIAQKTLAAGIPILASVSAPSSLAVKLARELGLTLIGFLRGRRFVVYAGDFRCLSENRPE